jgi:hypothetical protein
VAKKIAYKANCFPKEQVSSGGLYYTDSDCGKKMSGNSTLELGADTTVYNTLTSTSAIGTTIDFIFVKATSILAGTVTISLDGSTEIIKLLEGEAFSSQIASGATPKVHISDTATVEYMTGT